MGSRRRPLELRVQRAAESDLIVSVARGAKEVWIDTLPDDEAGWRYVKQLADFLGRGEGAGPYTSVPVFAVNAVTKERSRVVS